MPHSQGSPTTPILSRINPIPPIDADFFKFLSIIVLPSTPRTSTGLFLEGVPVKIFEALLPFSTLEA